MYWGTTKVLNAVDLDCDNDGGSDCASIIAAGINFLQTNSPGPGGVIYFPPGHYKIGRMEVTDVVNVKLVGDGPNVCITDIRANTGGGDAAPHGFIFNGCSRIRVQGMLFDYVEGETPTEPYGIFVGSSLANEYSSDFDLQDLMFYDVSNPVSCTALTGGRFDNLRVKISSRNTPISGDLFYFESSFNIRITNCVGGGKEHYAKVASSCLHLNFCRRVWVTDCEFGDADGAGVKITSGASERIWLRNVTVERADTGFNVEDGVEMVLSGCHAALCAGNGFWVQAGANIGIDSSLALLNVQHGFHLQASSERGFSIQRCTAAANSTTTGDFSGIRFEDYATHSRAIGNRSGKFLDRPSAQKYGVSIGSTGTDANVVAANVLTPNFQAVGNFSSGAYIILDNG